MFIFNTNWQLLISSWLLPFFVTYLVIWELPKWILIPAFEKEEKYRKDKKKTRLVAAEYTDVEAAKKNFSKIIERLEKITRGTDQLIKREVAGNPVYSFKKGDRENLYFQIADKVVLLFLDSSVATQSLKEVVKHIHAP